MMDEWNNLSRSIHNKPQQIPANKSPIHALWEHYFVYVQCLSDLV